MISRIIYILIIFIIFSIIKIILNINDIEYIIILSTISFKFNLYHRSWENLDNKEILINNDWEKVILGIMFILLGSLGMYAFFVKGLYGIYLLINNFSFWGLVYIVFVIIFSFNFMKYI